MSLDISLLARDLDGNEIEVFNTNITHNLNTMAKAAGLYEPMWRPDESGWSTGAQLIDQLTGGVAELLAHPGKYRRLNPSNGWGTYDGLLATASEFMSACRKYPSARVAASR